MRQLVECVANFSEGRDSAAIDAICNAISRTPGVAILHRTSDEDHHRSVITFAGPPQAVSTAAVRSVGKAAELIDLNRHAGVHPRLGAADVVPFVPIEGVSLGQCVTLARQVGEEIWRSHKIPVYFYEAAAMRDERRRLENVRRGGFEGIRRANGTDASRRPDIGGPVLHPTAGAVIVGARKFLIAWNVNLSSEDLQAARDIARAVRESSGGLPAVKALGLRLESRGQVQVSVNLTDHERTPLHRVFEAISEEAASRGIRVAGTEIIGLIPRVAIEAGAEAYFRFENFNPSSIVERRLEEVLPKGFDAVLEQLVRPVASNSEISVAAMASAMGAALGERIARAAGHNEQCFVSHREFFQERCGGAEADTGTVETCLDVAERARQVMHDIGELSHHVAAECLDVQTATLLVRAAHDCAVAAARATIGRLPQGSRRTEMENRIQTLQ